ncbi:MAG TPA: hypothetical protein VFX23_11020 [Limnobacter sp.]|nr:hypothetical protein [Limnobacter sp.]
MVGFHITNFIETLQVLQARSGSGVKAHWLFAMIDTNGLNGSHKMFIKPKTLKAFPHSID